MNTKKLNEQFTEAFKNSVHLKESSALPTVSYEVVPGQGPNKASNCAETEKTNNYSKASSNEGKDSMPIVPPDVAYNTKVFKSTYSVDKMKKENFDVSSDVNALLKGSDMSEQLKEKTTVVIGSVIREKVELAVEEIKNDLEEQYSLAFKENLGEITEQVNINLQYGITQWMENNALSMNQQLETQIAMDFIADMKKLFEAHNITIPEGKGDIVEQLAEENAKLKDKLEKEIESNSKMKKEKDDVMKEQVIRKVSDGLSDVQVEKLNRLSEAISYKSPKQFEERITMLKEAWFEQAEKSEVTVLNESTGALNEDGEALRSAPTQNNSVIDFDRLRKMGYQI